MTSQEQQMIQNLTDRINNTPLSEKDPEAEQFLHQGLGRNPDGLYILAQTVLVQQYALEQAQKQLADTKAEMDQLRQQGSQAAPAPRHATSFLGNLLGLHEEPARAAAPPPPMQQQGYPQGGYQPVQEYGPGSFGPPQGYGGQGYGAPPPGYGPPQQGGFLRSAMQTATGVAAGALAFEGIESLMHGFGGSGGGSGFSSGGGRPEEIVNNYYGDAAGGEHEHSLSPDIEDRRGESSSFADAVTNDDHHDGFLDDGSGSDSGDAGTDDSSFDDGSGGDDTNY